MPSHPLRPALKRRPTYEEYRTQEPPQARLIRLRGLFDVLMDKDQREALADGRAKEAWSATARRARYGAGGPLARGSLARKEESKQQSDKDMASREIQLDADKSSPSTSATSSSSSDSSKDKEPATPSPPRQSYADELLSQCRQCRKDLEKDRKKRRDAVNTPEDDQSTSKYSWSSFWSSASSKESSSSSTSTSTASGSGNSSWWPWSHSSKHVEAEEPQDALEADYDGESGYAGSGVWGLSAVKGGSRHRERERQRREASKGDEQGQSDSKQQPPASKEDEDAHRMMIEWEGFLKYAEIKERELYKIFSELDKNGDMRLDVSEIHLALDRAGINLSPPSLEDFIASLHSSTRTSDPHAQDSSSEQAATPQSVTWPEFRDYLLLLPRKPSVNEIFRFYQVRKAFGLFGAGGIFSELGVDWGKERHGASSLTSDGDVSLVGEERKRSDTKTGGQTVKSSSSGSSTSSTSGALSDSSASTSQSTSDDKEDDSSAAHAHEEEEEDNDMIQSDVALKFLLAGGIAGAVSRTATAPFDRLKIYLITASRSDQTASAQLADAIKGEGPKTATDVKQAGKAAASKSVGVLGTAVRSLYKDGGGLKAFWLGNGLNCVKIFPESAIKFMSYEMSKRAFAKYVDHVSDSRDISGSSRFVSGGIGGITSQLAIYPIETLKTRLMASQGEKAPLDPITRKRLVGNELLFSTAKEMWKAGGLRLYYRGLTAGLIGVFPYSAIDMSTFEGIKLAWISYTGKEEPRTLALLAFGSISGSVGASTVYPLNLIRTRLQAAGTPAHPQVYDGFMDAVKKTYKREGVVGFYRGLVPTLAKVVPAVSISYVCYEKAKHRLGVAQ